MAMNPMKRKTRNAFLLGFIAALIVGGAVIAFLILQIRNKNSEISNKDNELKEATKTVEVCVADGKTSAGQGIKVKKKLIHPKDAPANALKLSDLDKYQNEDGDYEMTASINLTDGTVLTEDMIEKRISTVSYRLVEYSMISLPSKLSDGDYIDIRLAFSDGGNYVVLSKVEVIECNSTTVWLELNEEQMLTLDEAAIESYIIDGTRLYATQYLDSDQTELNVTYVPNELVKSLISLNAETSNSSDFQEVRDEVIDRILSNYSEDERTDKVSEGFETQKSSTQANRSELLGDMGY